METSVLNILDSARDMEVESIVLPAIGVKTKDY
jgi:hypothetical protein